MQLPLAEQKVCALLESMRQLLSSIESHDADGFEATFAEQQACFDALTAVLRSGGTLSSDWAGEISRLRADILDLAGRKLEVTRDELTRIRRARTQIGRTDPRESIPRFISQRA